MSRGARAIAIFGLAAILATSLGAQKKPKDEDASTRTLQGQVTDASDQPIKAAVVQLKDMKTLQIRSYITKEDGMYHFSGLKMDVDYQVKADANGMTSGSKTVSVFDARKVATINLKVDKK